MWLSTLYIENIMESLLRYIMDKGVDDVVLNGFKKNMWVIRFSKNNLDITRFHDEAWIDVYIGFRKRRLFLRVNGMDEEKTRVLVDRVLKSINYLPPYPGYIQLPSKIYNYVIVPDTYVDDVDPGDLSKRLKDSINLGLEMKITDVSGSLSFSRIKHLLYTSTGNRGEYKRSNSNLNLRITKRKNISYIINREDVDPDKIEVEDLVSSTVSRLKKTSRVSKINPGKYNVLLSPTVMGNLFNYIGKGLSAYNVLTQNSPFILRIGEKIIDDRISLSDKPLMPGNPGACSFDMEGVPTKDLDLIERGVLKNYVHNLSTAHKFEVESTGHAGFLLPTPHSLISHSDEEYSFDDLLIEIKNGLYITNIWCTKFHNYFTGDFFTLQRDIGFIIKDGELSGAVSGAGISENILKLFNKVIGMSSDRSWVKGWGCEIPSLMPNTAFRDVSITSF